MPQKVVCKCLKAPGIFLRVIRSYYSSLFLAEEKALGNGGTHKAPTVVTSSRVNLGFADVLYEMSFLPAKIFRLSKG